jgi:hypothetical protein
LLQYLARQQRLHIFMRETRLVAASTLEDWVDKDAAEVEASNDAAAAAAAAALGETMGANVAVVVVVAPVKIGGGVALKAHRPHR